MQKKVHFLSAMVIFFTLTLTISSEGKSMYGIGMRVVGDSLLVKDILRAPSSSRPRNQTISFNYSISRPITYIEITSENNVKAEVNFSYQDDLVEGSVTSINTVLVEVTISIYGFDETVLGVNPSLILNQDSNFGGLMEPIDDDDEEYSEEENVDIDGDVENIDDKNNDENNYEYDDDGQQDNLLRIGQRQNGDYKIHESFEVSAKTDEPSNHSVVFYYIDEKVITSAEFTVFDSLPNNHPVVEYNYLSPHSLKATISDAKTTSLFVQLKLYGYEPDDLPVGFSSMLPTTTSTTTTSKKMNLDSFPLLKLKLVNEQMNKNNNNDRQGDNCPCGTISMSKSLSTTATIVGFAGIFIYYFSFVCIL